MWLLPFAVSVEAQKPMPKRQGLPREVLVLLPWLQSGVLFSVLKVWRVSLLLQLRRLPSMLMIHRGGF